jgi:hypothetical protein
MREIADRCYKILVLLGGNYMSYWGLRRRMREYGRMRM